MLCVAPARDQGSSENEVGRVDGGRQAKEDSMDKPHNMVVYSRAGLGTSWAGPGFRFRVESRGFSQRVAPRSR